MKINLPLFHKKDIVVTIHGFGFNTLHEMDPLKAYLEKEGFEVWNFEYFNPRDITDLDIKQWIERCEEKMRLAIKSKRKIHLLGFSMGGVIASYLASVYPVADLLLAAPAFYPVDFQQIERVAKEKIFASGPKNDPSMNSDQTKSFLSVVSNYRNSIFHVDCPILILHGTADDVISYKSSKRIVSLLDRSNTRLMYLEGAKHRFLYDGPYESLVFPIIRDYFRSEMTPWSS